MPELILFSIAESLLMKSGSTDFQEMGSMYGFGKELTKVRGALTRIKTILVDADKKQETSHAEANWVRRFKDAVYDADDLLDEFATQHLRRTADMQGGIRKQISYFFSSSNQLLFRFKILRGMKDIVLRLDYIANDISEFNFVPRARAPQQKENRERVTHTSQSKPIGTDELKQGIVHWLMEWREGENVSIGAIVGMGGLGKTTLAQLVYNDESVVKYFDLRMWVCFPDDFDVNILVRKIIRSATGIDVKNLELNQLKIQLHKVLNQKRYLLVLDDVWNEDGREWDAFITLLPSCANGSKIVVTTRSFSVASVMGVDSPYVLKCLTEDESWALFTKAAFRGAETVPPHLIEIGKEIVAMCAGVPLLIEILGAMLCSETEVGEWLSIRNKQNLMLRRDAGGVFNSFLVLKLIYDRLPEHLKQCFSYCSLFPKGFEYEKKLLVKLWMAQGYIYPLHGKDDLEDIGDEYFEALLSRSLFQEVQKDAYDNILSCKMHDLILELAQFITGSDIHIFRNDVRTNMERVHHVSLIQPSNPEVEHVLKEKSLRTLFLHSDHDSKDDEIANTIISSCRGLRVLNLNGLIDKKVPQSIAKLIQLRYLDLSDNDFEVLPSAITMLQNLQTLRLLRCGKLKELPGDIEKLLNLRHLEIQGCESLTHMPSGLGRLSMLRSLPLFVVGNDSVSHGTLSELKRLDHLRGELSIAHLERLKGHMALEAMEANLKGKAYLECLELEWQDRWDLNAKEVMEGLQPHENLKGLNIKSYGGEYFPSWMMNDGLGSLLPRLIRIEMRNCEQCKVLPPLGLLPHLKYLELEDLSALECMQESSPTMPFFPSLEILRLCKLRNVKGWSKDVTAEQPLSFPRLSKLVISCCHNLISLSLHSSPFLSQFDMNHCDNFTSLLLPSSSSLSQLDIKDCPNLTSLQLPSSSCLPKLRISGHRYLKSLALPSSPYLSELYITDCASLTSLELNPSPCLSILHICDSPNLTISQLPSFPCLEEVHLSYVSEELVQQFMRTSSSLKSLKIQWVVNLILLSKDELQHLTSLQHLIIHGCHGLMSLSQVTKHLTALEKLEILHCRGLLLSDKEDDADDGLQFQELRSLHELVIKGIPKLVSLPKRLQHVTTLKTLTICDCSGLATLPNWIGSLMSLTQLQISGCPKLKSLPEEMYLLSTLQKLKICDCSGLATLPDWIGSLMSLTQLQISGCPKLKSLPEKMHLLSTLQQLKINNCPHLSRRCREETGEDWPKIYHVPEILLDGKRMTSS